MASSPAETSLSNVCRGAARRQCWGRPGRCRNIDSQAYAVPTDVMLARILLRPGQARPIATRHRTIGAARTCRVPVLRFRQRSRAACRCARSTPHPAIRRPSNRPTDAATGRDGRLDAGEHLGSLGQDRRGLAMATNDPSSWSCHHDGPVSAPIGSDGAALSPRLERLAAMWGGTGASASTGGRPG